MDIREKLKTESIVRRLQVWQAVKRLREEEREAAKEKRPIPPSMRARLQSDIADARLNVNSVMAALGAAEKYPPLRRAL